MAQSSPSAPWASHKARSGGRRLNGAPKRIERRDGFDVAESEREERRARRRTVGRNRIVNQRFGGVEAQTAHAPPAKRHQFRSSEKCHAVG